MGDFAFAGKMLELKIEDGLVYHHTYSADGKTLHYETIAGPMEGASEDVYLHTAEVAPGVHLVCWTEISGKTAAYAINLNTNTVQAFWTYQAGKDQLGELRSGTVTTRQATRANQTHDPKSGREPERTEGRPPAARSRSLRPAARS